MVHLSLQRTMTDTSAQIHDPRGRSRRQLAWATTALALSGSALLSMPQGAQAQPINNGDGSYTFHFDINAGATPPAGSPAWLSALISPLNGGNGVTIDLNGNLQNSREFITKVGFNVIDKIQNLSWSCSSSFISCNASSVDQEYNNPPKINFANGIQGLDLAINLPIANNRNRFQGNDTARFTLNGTGLTPLNFLTTNDPGSPVTGVFSAARVQGLQTGSDSTTIIDPVPSAAPGPLPLLGAGVALGFSRRLRRRLNLGQSLN